MLKDPPLAGVDEVESGILRWRERALDFVLWVALTTSIVPLVMVFSIAPGFVPAVFRFFSLAMYLLLLAAALARRLPHAVRGWVLVAVVFSVAAMALAATGLEGAGRLLLLAAPLYGMVLLGARAGYLAAAASLALYATAAYLNAHDLLPRVPLASDRGYQVQLWILQGAMMVAILGPVVVLINRFIDLLRGALRAERVAVLRIGEADRERRRLELVLLETGERQRREVGHQLHDGPCQQLTAALLRCKVAQKSLTARGAQQEVEHIEAIAEMLDASVGEIHDLARGLSPPALSPGALPAALADMARSVGTTASIACEFAHDGAALPDSPGTASQLFRIAQEAVNNAARHGKPTRIRIELARGENSLRLTVRDDGVGLPSDADRGGMGLRIMRHRAELMGGTLAVGPADGAGTAIVCTVPVPSPGAAREERP